MSSLMLINPRKRRKARKANPVAKRASVKRRRRNPLHLRAHARRAVSRVKHAIHRRHKRRRNPLHMGGIVKSTLKPALIAAGGAIAVDVIWGVLPVPANLKTGPAKHAAKAVGAIAVGMILGKVAGKSIGHQITMGGLTVVFHQAIAEQLAKVAPNLHLSGYESVAYPVGEYLAALPSDDMDNFSNSDASMSAYMDGSFQNAGTSDYSDF